MDLDPSRRILVLVPQGKAIPGHELGDDHRALKGSHFQVMRLRFGSCLGALRENFGKWPGSAKPGRENTGREENLACRASHGARTVLSQLVTQLLGTLDPFGIAAGPCLPISQRAAAKNSTGAQPVLEPWAPALSISPYGLTNWTS